MYQLSFYVPEAALETVKQAVFAAGGGRFEQYEHCCWQIQGQGQFKPLAGSQPHIGKVNKPAHVNEYKVEMVCEDNKIAACVQALKEAHPYEEPAYSVISLVSL
jgi:hypothetical protein